MKLIAKIFIVILSCSIFVSCSYFSKSVSFDSEKWKIADFKTKHVMADDIIKNKLIKDRTKTDVLELLGEPTERGVFSKLPAWYYRLDDGYFLGNKVFEYSFIVKFDKSGEKVELVGIVD
jgi:outer membrane protein assembly factor BamE (lipoprotein component of BamABCDE complex)